MTSWLRTCGTVTLRLLLCCWVAAVSAGASGASGAGDGGGCWSEGITSCAQCLSQGPQCGWCFKEDFLDGTALSRRCDTPPKLLERGCPFEFIEWAEVKVEVEAAEGSTQVSPQVVSITLRPGAEASMLLEVRPLERYPVDLYYLVDVSASMQENLDQLKTVGVALSLRMMEHSSDLWLGFGSFVDKPVSPYINVHPSKINNPCSDYEIRCRPAHGFHHVLSMTANMSDFTRVIKRQRISGNMDTPEGGLDAMLQAAVCQEAVGWRPEAKRLLLLMTDQPSHLALDSRLAGIVVPHDGRCHLENNLYTASTRMDHPSLGQLSDKLLENHIYSIFAVEKQQYHWYEELVRLLPASYLGKLGLFQAPNLIDLVVDAYKKLLSEVKVAVSLDDRAVGRYRVSVTPLCPRGSTPQGHGCVGVRHNQTVYFNISVGLSSCPGGAAGGPDREEVAMVVRPVGYNESTLVRIRSSCGCTCGAAQRCHDQHRPEEAACGSLQGGAGRDGGAAAGGGCRAEGSEVDCSGRGLCECGRCVCEQSKLGAVYGKHCELDDFSCPYEGGLLCAGRGVCESGRCVCADGWGGDTCGCSASTAACQSADGSLCSGRGRCQCGRCVCDDPQLHGDHCERCPACQSSCQSNWNCVDCHVSHGLGHLQAEYCNSTCQPSVSYSDKLTGEPGQVWVECLFISGAGCRYRFQARSHSGQSQLHIGTRAECAGSGRLVGTFLSVCALTVLCGLVLVAVSRLLLQRRSRPAEGAHEERDFGKDLSYVPTSNEKTVTYRRERPAEPPLELHIQLPKMPLGSDSWQF